jgi:antitoxin (DNA-binding transcriptional repressor) of toxin-antitoxin stability system
MTTTIDLAVSQPTLEELLKLTAAGTEVVLVNGGTPVARLTPSARSIPTTAQPRTPDLFPGAIWASEDFDDPLPDEFWLGGEP